VAKHVLAVEQDSLKTKAVDRAARVGRGSWSASWRSTLDAAPSACWAPPDSPSSTRGVDSPRTLPARRNRIAGNWKRRFWDRRDDRGSGGV